MSTQYQIGKAYKLFPHSKLSQKQFEIKYAIYMGTTNSYHNEEAHIFVHMLHSDELFDWVATWCFISGNFDKDLKIKYGEKTVSLVEIHLLTSRIQDTSKPWVEVTPIEKEQVTC